MRIILFAIVFVAAAFSGCQKEEITIGPRADDTFYIKHEDAAMHVLVRGNTASKVFMIVVHGGPGSSGYIYNTPKMAEIVQKEFAVVYYDQRNAGASQGNVNVSSFNLDEYANDLLELINVLKLRYGQDIRFFLMSKSFGGMVASAFMTKGNNQDLISGWLFVDASHNYGLNDSLTYQMLLDAGNQHISQNLNANKWRPIVDYCVENPPGPFTTDQSIQLNQYGWKAQKIIEGLEPYVYSVVKDAVITEHIPVTSFLLGRTNALDRKFNDSLSRIKFSFQLNKVTVPVLVCFGKLDFVCPQGLGDDFLKHIGSTDKQKIIFNHSAHHLEEQEGYYNAFVKFVFDHL